MALEIKVVGTFQRNPQNFATEPNKFHFKDYVRFSGRVNYACAALCSININSNSGIKNYGIRVLAGPHPEDPNAAEGVIIINGETTEGEQISADAEYMIIADIENN
ncbi:hypothetical protein AX282_21320 [Bacillus spizizenii]|uniref:hypothetical protein n=1 Tax=Bacillus spizizenii TaxID=96241 RepID=UPI000772D05D|nr:hypothetical protein [Bacillus spizizenii]KXJ36541.1 hypothetical protein AX282_21320 [Bacillus spizizenii]